MQTTVNILKKSWPFLITVVLWRLNAYFWNPAGVLSLIPIFYFTFVRPINWFPLVALLFCFLIDYRAGLPLFWTSLFCLFYAITGFQNYIDIPHMDKNAILAFAWFVGVGVFILMFSKFTWSNFINNLWLFVWLIVLYIPITALDKRMMK
jgi:hypothetical protein